MKYMVAGCYRAQIERWIFFKCNC